MNWGFQQSYLRELNHLPCAEPESSRLRYFEHLAKCLIEGLRFVETRQRATTPGHSKRGLTIRVYCPGNSNVDVRLGTGPSPQRVRNTTIHFSTELTFKWFHCAPS